MVPNDMSSIEQRQLRKRDEPDVDCFDDSGSALLLDKARPNSWTPSCKLPRVMTIQHDVARNPTTLTQMARYLRLCAFIAIESLWLGFALFSNFHIFLTGSDRSVVELPGGFAVNRGTMIKSGLSTVGIIIQLVALLPVAEITVEFYSGEWAYVLDREDGQLTRVTDRVSTLTSTFRDRFVHTFDRRSSWRYRITFTVALLSILLQTIAPGSLAVSSDIARVNMNVTIGALDAERTDPTGRMHIDANGVWEVHVDQSDATVLARDLLLQATRYEYVTWIENSTVDYNLSSNTLLYGMPPRDFLTLDVNLEYQSDGVQFQYECQWLAPTYIGGDLLNSNWTFGGDMEGTLDYNAIPISTNPRVAYGIWPLIVTSGSGSNNGSFVWLFLGAGTGANAHLDVMPIDLSSIPASQRTYNVSGWNDIFNFTASTEAESTDASVLFCDPHMKLVSVYVTLQGQQLSADVIGNVSVGNIDWGEASRMLGRSLNGMPWDSVQYEHLGLNFLSGLSQLAFKFALQNSYINANVTYLPLVPQSLANITSNLQSYTQIAGAHAYLDGSVGSTKAAGQRLGEIQRLVCSLPQWYASVALLVIIATFLGAAIVMEGSRQIPLVPLTLASVVDAIESEKPNILHESSMRESFESKRSHEKSAQM